MSILDPMADVIEQMPEPSEFSSQIREPGAETLNIGDDDGSDFNFETPPESAPSVSAGPESFNPEIHCVNPDGSPKLTPTGKFRRKRGKKNASPTPSLVDVDHSRMANAKAAAQVSIACTFVAGQIAFGPEGAPQDNEPAEMEAAYTQFYYLSEKPVQIPPWLPVVMVTAVYAAKRMAQEKPRSRVIVGINWLYAKGAAAFNYMFHWAM